MKKTIGRVVFGIIFCIFGSFHLIKGSQMAGAVPAWIPGGVIWVYVTGIILFLAGISILINKKASLLSLILAVLLLCFVLMIHLPQVLNGDQTAMTSLLKDTALASAALFMSGVLID
jgi:putative oxidoreductase